MNTIDRFLQSWRIRIASKYISPDSTVLDIGCYQGELFQYLGKNLSKGVGIDPELKAVIEKDRYSLHPGKFPQDYKHDSIFDFITALATLEHIPIEDLVAFSDACARNLRKGGHLIITVPSPMTENVLRILKSLRLIEGMSLEEHTALKPDDVPQIFPPNLFQLIRFRRFQLGLNNLFIFVKL